MKMKNTSLFFYALLLLCYGAFSQQKIDSTSYYHEIVKKPKKISELISAYKYFEKEKKIAKEQKYYLRAAYHAMQVSNIENRLGQYYDSESSAIEGLKYLDSVVKVTKHYIQYEGTLLNRLGVLKRKLRDYEKSFNYYLKFLKVAQTKRDSAIAYNNMGVAYNYLKKYNEAKNVLEKAHKISSGIKDENILSLALSNLGYAKAMLGELKGLSYMDQALYIRKKTNDPQIYETYKNIVDYYKSKNDKVRALYYAKKGYKAAKDFNSLPYKENALKSLIDLGENQYAKKFMNLIYKRDSISLSNENVYAEAKYDYAKEEKRRKEAEFSALEEQSRRVKEYSKRVVYQAIGGLILLISVFLFITLRSRHKKEKLKTQFDTERQISKKLHDEVANDIFAMMSQLQNDPTTKKELIDSLEEAYLKTRDISKSNAALDVSKDFDILLKDLIASYKTADVKIFTRNISEIPWDTIPNLKKETLYRVIQELMTNMKKHSKANLVTLQFEMKRNSMMVSYVDNGVGCELNYGNGLRNTENRIELAGGTITFESEANKGFRTKIIV